MPDETTYYRSEHPAVRDWWAEHMQRVNAYGSAMDGFLAEHPGCTLAFWDILGREKAVGLFSDTCPGPLWQQRRGQQHWTPRLKTAEGKALAERISQIAYLPPTVPGMPSTLRDAGGRRSPGWARYAEVVWLEWGCPAELVEADPAFDPRIWQRAKASEYHLAREAAEAGGEPDA